MGRNKCKKILETLMWMVLLAGLLFSVYNALRIYVFISFRVPTPSMEPTVMVGRHVLVNKLSYGRRLFDVPSFDSVRHGRIMRGWAMSKPERGDLMVFNQTCFINWDTISFDIMKYFVKRCVGLPGDSFFIDSCRYRVVGSDSPIGLLGPQTLLERLSRDTAYVRRIGMPYETLPFWDSLGWNIRDFGPMYIPKKGDTIFFNEKNVRLYRKYIEWELGHKIVWVEDRFLLPDGTPIHYHIMHQNYYFMCGDNASNSLDSRFWGLVPEEFIVGRVDFIW